jgi:signal transduction histidine kinase
LRVEVKDNGVGINQDADKKHHWAGILGMNERAHIFGGQIRVRGEPGKGTKVQLAVPIRRNRAASPRKALIQ